LPRPVIIESNYPNPFSEETLIRFQLLEAGTVTIDIYSVDGKKVTTLTSQAFDAGRHGTTWDTLDEGGNPVSSGVYFARIRVRGQSQTYQVSRKIVLAR
jgi:flagellar hook assembly protein FlgD